VRSKSSLTKQQTVEQRSHDCWRWGRFLAGAPPEFLHVGNAVLYWTSDMLQIAFNFASCCYLCYCKTDNRPSLMFADLSSRVVDPIGLTVSTSSCLPRHHGRKSRPSNSKASSSASLSAGRENGAGNLSATLDKLWFWEKKLYQEIKVHNHPHTSTNLLTRIEVVMLAPIDDRSRNCRCQSCFI
jgi:hypothetical protein